MSLLPSDKLTEDQVNAGLKLVIKDGVATEAMATLTGGAFLVALAIKLGASNFEIGLVAALPTLTNIFQLFGIYLISITENRRKVTVFCSLAGRLPLLFICFIPFLFPLNHSLGILIFFLFIHFLMAAISGCSWNSWMKDLVPENKLGSYFSERSRIIHILNVILSITVAILLDFIKRHYPHLETYSFSAMFLLGGIFGLWGVYMLSQTPEPKILPLKKNLFALFKNPLKNRNFRNLLIFNGFWAFAINLAAPFFSVYMLKVLSLPLYYVVGFNILSQITNIMFIRIWGRYSDKYSNKSIINICAPIYLLCILGWTFTTMPTQHFLTIPLLVIIFLFNGISVSGINLSLSNIGMKLAPKESDAIVYLTTKGVVAALFAGVAPIIGGMFADFFAMRSLSWNIEWKSPQGQEVFHTLDLQQWDFFFAIAFLLGIFALYRLSFVVEDGDVKNKVIVNEMVGELKREVRMNSTIAGMKAMIYLPFSLYESISIGEKYGKIKKNRYGFIALLQDKDNFNLSGNDKLLKNTPVLKNKDLTVPATVISK